MPTIKMGGPIQESLFEEAEKLARRLNLTRSWLVSHAIEGYMTHHRNQEILAKVNEVYAEGSIDYEGRDWLAPGRRDQRRLSERTL